MRRVGAGLLLLVLVLGAPAGLLSLGFYSWGQLNLWVPADVRVLLGVLTVVGWSAWVVFAASLVAEVVRVASGGRLNIRLPGLALPQALAGALLAAVIATATGPSLSALATGPGPSVPTVTMRSDADAQPASDSVHRAADSTRDTPTVVHIVAEGDDLWSLAAHYYGAGEQWRRIVQANPDILGADPLAELKPGTALAVVDPVDQAASAAPAENAEESAAVPGAAVAEPVTPGPAAPGSYVVKKGDTLWLLAAQRLGDGARYPEIVSLNPALADNPDHIEPGWSILLPMTPASSEAPSSPDRAARPPVNAEARGVPLPGEGLAGARAGEPVGDAQEAGSTEAGPVDGVTETDLDASALRLVVGGLAGIAASGVLGSVLVRRRARDAVRAPGRAFPVEDADLQRFENALGLVGATPADGTVRCPPRMELLELTLRALAAHWWERGVRPPGLERVVIGSGLLTLEFAVDVTSLPTPLRPDGRAATASWDDLAHLPELDRPVAYPGLVSVGSDRSGHTVLADVVTSGVLTVAADAGDLSAQSVSAMVVELGCSPWASELRLIAMTRDPTTVQGAVAGDVDCYTEPERVIVEIERVAGDRRARLTTAASSYADLRLDPDRADAWAPVIAVFEEPLTPPLLERVRQAVGTGELGVAAIVVLDAATSADSPGHHELRLVREPQDAEPVAWLGEDGPALAPQTMTPATRMDVARLLNSAKATDTLPASWWREEAAALGPFGLELDDEEPESAIPEADPLGRTMEAGDPHPPGRALDAAVASLHPGSGQRARRAIAPASGPRLRLFGPVSLDFAQGEPPAKAQRRCTEYCAWLLEHPDATASEMNAAMFVTDGSRRSNLSRLRSWLGSDASGRPYLPDAYSGRIRLDEQVTSDWAEFRAVLSRGVNRATPDELRDALALVAGPPLADASPGEWAWASGQRDEMSAMVRDAALVLARLELARADADAAEWALDRGDLAAPGDELLGCEWMRVHAARGDDATVSATFFALQRAADRRGDDLRTETLDLASDLALGRPVPA